MHFFLFLAFVIAVAFVTVAFQNPEPINLKFINWIYSGPLALILTIPFAAGLLTGIFLIFPSWWKRVMSTRTLKKRVKELEAELAEAEKRAEGPAELPAEAEQQEESR